MAMAPQYDAITGGDVLRIPALQSPNYVAGTSGWIIKGDGTVEFNSGTFRGSVEIGTDPGQHIILANNSTGDAVDVYNSSNALTAFIDNQGRIESRDPATGKTARLTGGQIFLGNENSASGFSAELAFLFNVGGHDELQLFSGHEPGDSDTSLTLISDVGSIGNGYMAAFQRQITGAVVQTDTNSATGNVLHRVRQSFTTNGSGDGSFNPSLNFTPSWCQVTPTGLTFTVPGTQILIWRDVLTSTNCAFRVFSPGGAAFVGTMTADFEFSA